MRPIVFDELAHAGDEHLDPAYVAGYERKAQTDPGEDIALLQASGLHGSSTLLDFGAGTGTFALAAARVCRRVVAIDVSAPMLERLREGARGQHIENIETVQSGFLTYRHDFWKGIALQRVAEALRPGGVFFLRDLVYSFDPGEADKIFEGWLARAPDRPEEGYTAEDLAMHIRTEHSTYSWLLEPMLERAGFEIRNAEYSSQVFAGYTCVRR